ncbi:sodium:proton exchanger [Williamsia sp. 1138]|uniref:cation:proton antiporter n=1 Tax=Williamsia sp. 1138 TaxID=1903117 RepID=UPI000A11F83F|nr:sodium:proton antiporter [Williamsia sp. 1138]OZG25941.1 sodium:proton exchanger [Williamsia sp. 1138]
MELTLVGVVAIIAIVAVAVFAGRLGVAAPLLLVIVGVGLSFVPGVPDLEVQPELILAGVLPPLLYSAAVNMPAQDFRRNFKPISALAVVLVVVTTVGTGWFFHALIPDIGWPAALALGAVISPTDAVAATSVGKKLGLPSRVVAVLEGEGLVNDASALVLLRSAVAALGGTVTLWGVAGDFVFAVLAAVVVGAIVGYVNVRIRGLLNDSVLTTAISLVVPFIAYIPAEEVGASGVLSVVVAGLITGHLGSRYLRAQDRLAETTNWRTLAFLLEGAVFLFMGMELKKAVEQVQESQFSTWTAVAIGLVASAIVIALRIAFVGPMVGLLRRDTRRASDAVSRLDEIQARLDAREPDERFTQRRLDYMETRVARVSADLAFHLNETLGWRGGVVLGWAGMRGAITVAAAQTLPQDTPHRPQLILIAFVVAATTLLLQGFTLPSVIRMAKVAPDDPERLRDEYSQLVTELQDAASQALVDPAVLGGVGEPIPDVVIDLVRADSIVGRVRSSREAVDENAADANKRGRAQYFALRLLVLAAEREALLKARKLGVYSSQSLTHAQNLLDLEEARLEQLDDDESE